MNTSPQLQLNVDPLTPLASQTLISLKWEDWKIVVEVGGWLLLASGVFVVLLALSAWWRQRGSPAELKEVTLKFGDLFEQKIEFNRDTQRIAFAAYSELVTRKVCLEFDEDHDLVSEVYDSWFRVFGVIRDLLKELPAHRLSKCPSTQQLADVLIKVLNQGMRPHLTKWQARFRRWYRHADSSDAAREKSPQDIQREFPQYEELVKELKAVSADFLDFSTQLRMLAVGRKENPKS